MRAKIFEKVSQLKQSQDLWPVSNTSPFLIYFEILFISSQASLVLARAEGRSSLKKNISMLALLQVKLVEQNREMGRSVYDTLKSLTPVAN